MDSHPDMSSGTNHPADGVGTLPPETAEALIEEPIADPTPGTLLCLLDLIEETGVLRQAMLFLRGPIASRTRLAATRRRP
ncbi:hypothetical protein [Kitasatospora cineracea]|uniref:Uncharacterized protein n=1 Tax=Kitasatospora cineracea TaxID=88074 RepID=A0A3N4R3A7_9ACTN|nr:hypothetical protein [Kitasatospora cineracea]RPE28033.1 hypothetical protein EDD38_7343 [Kitasatospora cineracea]